MDPQILIGLLGPFVIIGVLMAIILPIKHRRRNPPGTSETREAIRLDAAGQLAEAAALFTTAIAKVERRKGRRSKEVADLLVRLGSSHSRHGDPDAAEAAYGEALEIYRALPKATPADRAEAQYGLFFVRTAQKRDREALQLLEEATLGFDATYGLNHPRTEDTHHYLVRHYIAGKRFGDFARLLALLPARLSTEPADVVIRYGSLFLLYGLNLAPVGPDDDRGLRQIETALGLIEDTLMNESRPGDAPPGQTEAMLAPKGQIIGWSRMQTLTRVGTGFVLNKQTVPDYFMEHRRLATPSQFLIDALAARPASAEIRRRYARCIARLAALEGLEDQAVQWAEKAAS